MNFVQPIRNITLVMDIAAALKKDSERNFIMFLMGIYTGLRISDILSLKINDVKGKDYIRIKEKKTNNIRLIEIHTNLKRELKAYTFNKDPDDYLIKSRQNYNKPISRVMAYKILNDVARKFDIENIGTHTLRKTFGHIIYKDTKDVALLQETFGHSHPSITLRYIGVTQQAINKAIKNMPNISRG